MLAPILALAPIPASLARASSDKNSLDSADEPHPDAIQACDSIRSALRALASAEHEQAFALDLSAGEGGESPMVAARLAKLLDRSDRLREALRQVRETAPPHDPRVQECIRMGLHSLVEAEKLTTSIEEVLYGNQAGGGNTSEQAGSDGWRADAPSPRP